MKQKILMKNLIAKIYIELSQEYNFFAPVNVKGNIVFRKILNSEDIELNYLNSKIPPKEILFPKMEVLFEYKYEDKEVRIKERDDLDQKYLIFGIRPCDAHSFYLFENFLGFGKDKDEIYLKKRENTVLFGLGCNNPRQTCFCTSVGGYPFKKDDLDVFLVDLGDRYLVEAISNKGIEIIQQLTWLTNAADEDKREAEELAKKAKGSISTKLNIDKVVKSLETNFDHPIWLEVSKNCIGCGVCTFLCPTCTCFDVIDEHDHYGNRGRRIRIWDTCQFCFYTLHTSGHNPRPTKIERFRNRIMHKFSYYPRNYNLIGCVGCGRCILSCPVNNDIRRIFDKIEKLGIKREEVINQFV